MPLHLTTSMVKYHTTLTTMTTVTIPKAFWNNSAPQVYLPLGWQQPNPPQLWNETWAIPNNLNNKIQRPTATTPPDLNSKIPRHIDNNDNNDNSAPQVYLP